MADFATGLRAKILASAPVAADVGTQVYWKVAAQSAGDKYIVLTTISDPRPRHLKGRTETRFTRVQADCFAPTYGGARQLAEKVIAAVETPGTVGGVKFGGAESGGPLDLGEDVEGVGFVHRASVDLFIQHKLA